MEGFLIIFFYFPFLVPEYIGTTVAGLAVNDATWHVLSYPHHPSAIFIISSFYADSH